MVPGDLLFWWAVLAYTGATGLITFNKLHDKAPSWATWWLVCAGWLSHLSLLAGRVKHGGGLQVDLVASAELVTFMLGFIYLVSWVRKRQGIRSVGMLLLPAMAVTLLISRFLAASAPTFRAMDDPLLFAHVILSLGAYAFFTFAMVVALLDAYQVHALKSKHLGRIFSILPAMGVLETYLFRLLWMGFGLLTLSIISGMAFNGMMYGVYFQLTHKALFTWSTWGVFATLLVGRLLFGWRGRRAIRLTLGGYALLVVGYLGVKFVREFFL